MEEKQPKFSLNIRKKEFDRISSGEQTEIYFKKNTAHHGRVFEKEDGFKIKIGTKLFDPESVYISFNNGFRPNHKTEVCKITSVTIGEPKPDFWHWTMGLREKECFILKFERQKQ